MKENKKLGLITEENMSKEFKEKLDILKQKAARFKDLENEFANLQIDIRKLADAFVKEFGNNKQELGRIVS
jgi:uncharacterized protein YdcH (DUF465 family)